jgi:hypothetical protein
METIRIVAIGSIKYELRALESCFQLRTKAFFKLSPLRRCTQQPLAIDWIVFASLPPLRYETFEKA